MTSAEFQTTAIGSLPHHNIDAALQVAFSTSIPFLPQIPIRNPWEYMLAQALEGLPGLQAENDGTATLNLGVWESRSAKLDRELNEAFAHADSDPGAFEAFEPSAAISSSWQPFIWELEERGIEKAKIQIAGPLTSQWSVKTKEGQTLDRNPGVAMQIYRLVLARALSMTRRLQASGIAPLLYIDEPGLYGLMASSTKFSLGIQELKLMVQTLKKERVEVGIHCCSNTDWDAVLSLGVNAISLDTSLSLRNFLTPARLPAIEDFISSGGRLSLGVIPTARSSVLQSLEAESIFSELLSAFQNAGAKPGWVRQVLAQAIFTPACGLALHSVSDADLVMELLLEFRDFCEMTMKRINPS
jgi:methionine synthase II (cobalamin-independent)